MIVEKQLQILRRCASQDDSGWGRAAFRYAPQDDNCWQKTALETTA